MSSAPYPAFRTTRWTLVSRAASGEEPTAQVALEELCAIYWKPLREFAGRSGLTAVDAEDATQSFFADFLGRQGFTSVDPGRGRLRTFLCSCFANHLRDLKKRAAAKVRGGNQVHVSLDGPEHEGQPLEIAAEPDWERDFTRAWALATMDAAMARLDRELVAKGKAGSWEHYRGFLGLESGGNQDYAEAARSLGIGEGAVRVAVCRLRRQFRDALFATVADTLVDPTEANVRSEIRALIAALAG